MALLRHGCLPRPLFAILTAILLSGPRVLAQPPQISYTSATTQNAANGHFVVQITSASAVVLKCQIQYSGESFLSTNRNGTRTLQVDAVGSDGKPVIVSQEFGGFRTFTATVSCSAK